jgi:FkbM family methyltransferase
MSAQFLKKVIKKFLAKRGYQLSWTAASSVNGTDLSRDLGVLVPAPRPLCFDVGANKGQTIRLLQDCLQQPVIHAFEPTPILCEGLRQQDWGAGVSIHPVALGSAQSTMQLHTYAVNELNSLLPLTAGTENPFEKVLPTGTVEVEVSMVDRFCLAQGIELIDLLKIDTQGFDLEVLKGASGVLAAGVVRHVLVELNFIELYARQCSPWEVQAFLSSAGFRLVDYYEKNRHGPALGWCTALFRHAGADA